MEHRKSCRQALAGSPVTTKAILKEKMVDIAYVRGDATRPGGIGPRIGTGLAGGTWSEISCIITEELIDRNIPVTVYDLLGSGL